MSHTLPQEVLKMIEDEAQKVSIIKYAFKTNGAKAFETIKKNIWIIASQWALSNPELLEKAGYIFFEEHAHDHNTLVTKIESLSQQLQSSHALITEYYNKVFFHCWNYTLRDWEWEELIKKSQI